MPEVTITRDNWWPLVEMVREKNKKVPVWVAITEYYNICVESLLDPLSKSIFEMYHRLNGMQNENFETTLRLPAVYVAGCDCIKAEISRIRTVQNG